MALRCNGGKIPIGTGLASVIALSDEALCRLAIGATALPADRRGAFLARVAAIADPSPQCAYARRRRAGRVRVAIEVDLDDLAAFLRAHGVPIWDEHKGALAAALADLIVDHVYA
jgi:hypothetical protein